MKQLPSVRSILQAGRGGLLAIALSAAATGSHQTSLCTPEWQPTFGSTTGDGLDANGVIEFDDGTGLVPHMITGGFVRAFKAGRWVTLGGKFNGTISQLVSFDSGLGNGSELYAVGFFSQVGVAGTGNVVKWNGSTWASVGLPIFDISSAIVHDDGSGSKLYVGGRSSGPSSNTNGVARFDGSQWESVGTAFLAATGTQVVDLEVCNEGQGDILYAAGRSLPLIGSPTHSVLSWDGSNWSTLGSVTAPFESTTVNLRLHDLQAHDDGTGEALYVGGQFVSSDSGVLLRGIARWKNNTWSAVDQGINSRVNALFVYDDGTGSALYAGGEFTGVFTQATRHLARWDGLSWSPVGNGAIPAPGSTVEPSVSFLGAADFGKGRKLIAGGDFDYVGNSFYSPGLALWDGTEWERFPGSGLNGAVLCSVVFDDGQGAALYLGGEFEHADGVMLNHVAKWDGNQFVPLAEGLDRTVRDLTVFDDGTGPALYATGLFGMDNAPPEEPLRKWDGASWSTIPLGITSLTFGLPSEGRVLEVFDDGNGEALYIGGEFRHSGIGSPTYLARWDGSNSAFIESGPAALEVVTVMHAFDDGTGEALFVGVDFDDARVWRWNGLSWSQVGPPIGSSTGEIWKGMVSFDSGNGPELYVTGKFQMANGLTTCGIAKWNGAFWDNLNSPGTLCTTTTASQAHLGQMAVHDAGNGLGPRLYVMKTGITATGSGLWSYDGNTWEEAPGINLGTGLTISELNSSVSSLMSFNDGSGPALYVGGSFVGSEAGDSYIARYGGCAVPEIGTPFCFGNGGVSAGCTACPCMNDAPSGVMGGCLNPSGMSSRLFASGRPVVGMDTLRFEVSGATPSTFGVLISANNRLPNAGPCPPGSGLQEFDGLRCVGGALLRHGTRSSDDLGDIGTTRPGWGPPDGPPGGLLAFAGFASGQTRHFQCFYREDIALGCNSGQNTTNAVTLTFQ